MDTATLLANWSHHLTYFALIFGIDDILIALALMVVSAAITALTAKKAPNNDATPSTLAQFQVPSITEGTPQTVVFGDVWLTEWQVLWYGNLESTPIRAATPGKK